MNDDATPAMSSLLHSPGGIYSQSNNFLGVVQSAVDPRTGQFNLAIMLPTLMGNDLSGPSLAISLSFSALASGQTKGYGLGWSLLVSELVFNQDSAFLTLSTGEHFALDLQASKLGIGDPIVFADHKLKSLQVTRLNAESFRIDTKSGQVEILTQVADGGAHVAHELRSPEGRCLYLDWLSYNGVPILQQVRDETKVLFEVRRDSGRVSMVVNPKSASPFNVELWLLNDRLTNVKLPEVDSLFSFSYESIDVGSGQTLLFPNDVSGPLGANDSIFWDSGSYGHHVPPGGPIEYLPRVTSWLQRPGDPAANLTHQYEWVGTRNHLGFGSDAGFRWDSGRDNLYQVNSDYDYSVVETLSDNTRTELATITRVWNRFHLPILEATTMGQCQVRQETLYYIDPALGWEAQPPYCQLPRSLRTTYQDPSGERSEETEYRYDDYGNVLFTRFPTGVVETSEYYPANGSDDCPKDSLGMVRFLKKKTVTPAPSERVSPTLYTTYRYADLGSLIAAAPPHSVVVEEQAWNETDAQLMEITVQTYMRSVDAHYGRLETAVTTINGLSTTTRYAYIKDADRLRTRVIIEGHDFNTASPVSQSISEDSQSLLTGLTIEKVSAAGVITVYEYDALGRIIKTMIAKGSPYSATRLCAYHIDDEFIKRYRPEGSALSVLIEETDASGRRRRSWLDGVGRVVSTELEDLDNAKGTFRETSRTLYDALGRISMQALMEWDSAGNPLFELKTLTIYDDWGSAATVISPSGVKSQTFYDPIALRTEHWQVSASGKRSATQVVLSNQAGSPIRRELYDDQDALVRTVLLIRDGLDRVVEQQITTAGQPDIVTRYGYDSYSRVVEQALADDTRVEWTYAAHSDGEHPQSVQMTGTSPSSPLVARPLETTTR